MTSIFLDMIKWVLISCIYSYQNLSFTLYVSYSQPNQIFHFLIKNSTKIRIKLFRAQIYLWTESCFTCNTLTIHKFKCWCIMFPNHDLNKLEIYTTWEYLHKSYSFSGLMVFEKKIFFSIYSFEKFRPQPPPPPPNLAPPTSQVLWFKQTGVYIIWRCFHTS